MSATAARQLAEFCRALSWSALGQSTRDRTTELLLDHIGVTLAGYDEASSISVRSSLAHLGAPGPSSIIGSRLRTQPSWAALVNGTTSHAIEMDDCERVSSLHPGASVIPAALAVAEEVDATSVALLEAVVAGYEVTIRAGSALGPSSAYRRGFHPTGVAGVFGAAMAAGLLLGHDATTLTSGLGVAGGMAAGSLEYLTDGSWTKRLAPGWAAHAGIVSARLAAAGFLGPASVFEGPHGFLHAYGDSGEPALLLAGLGGSMGIDRVAIKAHAGCRYTHGLVDCMIQLREDYGLQPDEVERIDLRVLSIGSELVAEPIERKRHPRTVVDAQFSAPFAVAIALVHGRASRSEFSAANLADPRVRHLMVRTSCHRDPALDALYPEGMPARVVVRLRSGRELEASLTYPSGEPENPVGRPAMLARFVEFATPRLGGRRAARVASELLAFDEQGDVRGLVRRLAPAKP
ncbi:MAG: MmgE/PrpD family protein [Solirubrobacterales bacterium]